MVEAVVVEIVFQLPHHFKMEQQVDLVVEVVYIVDVEDQEIHQLPHHFKMEQQVDLVVEVVYIVDVKRS